jgi:type IV secretion/conjugal transfer VirB4 family ATPase
MFPEIVTPEIIQAFRASSSLTALMGFAGIGVGGMAFVGLSIPGVARLVLPPPQETRLADVLPFDRVLPDGKTIICRDGSWVQCLEMRGLDDTFFNAKERENLMYARKDWIDVLSDGGAVVRSITIREQVDMTPRTHHDNPVLREISRRWNGSFRQAYRNRQFIVISVHTKGRSGEQKLKQAVATTKTILHKYGPRELSQHDEDLDKRPLALWARLTSPISQPHPGGIGTGASDAICGDQVEFGLDNGMISFRSGDRTAYCSVVGIRSLGDFTYEAFINKLNTAQGELIILQAIEPWSKTKAAFQVAQHQRLSLAQRFSPAANEQFLEALDRIEGNTDESQTLSNYTLIVFAYGKTREEAEKCEMEVKRAAAELGISAVREGATAQASWFCQFPGYKIWPRAYKLFSKNVATHVTIERPADGLKRCDWGDGPIATFRTASGTPYAFQFHISEDKAAVAHAVAIGPTGTGKTTLINFLTGMAMRHEDLRCYLVDRHGGAFIFTNAIGGSYVTFDGSNIPGELSALNPFQCNDDSSNRSFLRAFLHALSEMDDPDAIEEIGFAVEAAFEYPGLPRDKRSLTNIYDACFSKSRPLRKALHKWVDPAIYGKVFNARQDTLDLTATRLVAFDFTRLYEHDDLARAVILYLMHRIQSTISELKAPALIFIDETEPIVRHPIFRSYFMQMLQEYRKRRAAVISAFQRPEAIMQAGLGEAIRGQAQTTFFFQNPQAQEREYADWGLTEREWDYIKGRLANAKSLKRSVLMKRATGESIIIDTDLSALGPLIRIFYSDEPSRGLAEKLISQHGPDWLAIYLDAVS